MIKFNLIVRVRKAHFIKVISKFYCLAKISLRIDQTDYTTHGILAFDLGKCLCLLTS